MPRKILNSHKKRKVQLQEKRAVKRGDMDPEELKAKHRARRQPSQAHKRTSMATGSDRLKSVFADVPREYLIKTRNLAFSTKLKRPLDGADAKFPIELLTERDVQGKLRCPERPKFKFGITKKELERNEEGVFQKWKEGVEGVMRDWMASGPSTSPEGRKENEEPIALAEESIEEWPRGPSWFESNLEVWRQLWRVTESSSILLLLLDARCVPLHCPPSLRTYLQRLTPKKEFILVLTKADLVDQAALEGWKTWIKSWWGDERVQVVSVMSYDTDALYQPGRAVHRPEIPEDSLDELIAALKTAHQRLLTPPEAISSNPDRLQKWKPRVRPSVDWDDLLRTRHFTKTKQKSKQIVSDDRDEEEEEAEGALAEDVEHEEAEEDDAARAARLLTLPLTVGLIGQPNVGKSSLLNALLGQQRVRASRTPGKTKYRQTMFWGEKKEVLFADSPGLVCPSLVGVELQVLAGILPISQIPSLPACIYFAASHLPVETIFNVPPPTEWSADDTLQSNKTYRAGFERSKEAIEDEERRRKEARSWTAGLIMEGRALDRGYLTAKGGRPDANRAANGMMRLLADGKIRWCFWPPNAENLQERQDLGIWIGDFMPDVVETEDYSDHEHAQETTAGETITEEDDDEEEEEDESDESAAGQATSFFAALDVEDDDEEDVTDEETEE